MDPVQTAPASKCRRCQLLLKHNSKFCSNCGLVCLENPSAPHSKAIFAAIIGSVGVLIVLLAVLGVRSVASEQPVTAVYITPPPPAEAPVTVAPVEPIVPPVLPKSPAPILIPVPTPQSVELPSAFRYVRMKTQMVGATTGGGPFEIRGVGDEPIIGFRITTGQWAGKTIIRNLQPVFTSDNSVVTQSMVVARPGYAVGGVIVNGDDHVTAMRVVFMKIQPHSLSIKNAYTSDWIGDPSTDDENLLGGHGQFVVGIYGRKGMNVDALGLYLLAQAMPAAPIKPAATQP